MPVRDASIDPDCLRTCEDDMFGYGNWYTVFAWWSVEFKVQETLLKYVKLIPPFVVSQDDLDELSRQVALKTRALLDADQDLVLVNRVCAFVGLHMALPYLCILIVFILVACSLLQTAVLLACDISNLIVTLLLSSFF
jgi:hypothetical protein